MTISTLTNLLLEDGAPSQPWTPPPIPTPAEPGGGNMYTNTYTNPVPSTVTIPNAAVGGSALMGGFNNAVENAQGDISTAAAQGVQAAGADAASAQNTASALTGTARQGLAEYNAPDAAAIDTIKEASSYQDPSKTVAGQLSQLLNQDNPYMQAAKTRAEETAQKYGLLGSSMAVGAAHRAAIESGLPIAQQDAETAAKYGLQQQAAENQVGVVGAESAYNAALMNTRVSNEMQQANLQSQLAANQTGLEQKGQLNLQKIQQLGSIGSQGLQVLGQLNTQELQSRWNFVTQDATTRLEASLNEKLQAQKIDSEIASAVRTSASELVQNHQISVEKLLSDPDFLRLGANTVKDTINNMLKSTTASVRFLADSTGVNLDSYLDSFTREASFTATVNPPAE